MKVTLLKPYGYCSGVARAIDIAIKTKDNNPNKDVVVLGMLVHNKTTLQMLENKGIKTIYDKKSSLFDLAISINKPSIVLLSAHGHDKKLEQFLIENGHEIIDTTCPFVENSFNYIKNHSNSDEIVFYLGVTNHPESNAALTKGNIILIDVNKPVIPEVSNKKIHVVAQTTLSKKETEPLVQEILNKYPSGTIFASICDTSTKRQEALQNIEDDIDGILIVGSKESNNCKTLEKLAKSLYPNLFIKIIETKDDLNKKDLLGLSHIAISSSASTPKEKVEEIEQFLLD